MGSFIDKLTVITELTVPSAGYYLIHAESFSSTKTIDKRKKGSNRRVGV